MLDTLIGETLTHIDVFEDNDEILLTTKSGRQIKIYHSQDCCESVGIESTEGDWKELIGKVIINAYEQIECGEAEYGNTYTSTELTFKVDGATVISKWYGSSNGYYSESVDFAELNWNKK